MIMDINTNINAILQAVALALPWALYITAFVMWGIIMVISENRNLGKLVVEMPLFLLGAAATAKYLFV